MMGERLSNETESRQASPSRSATMFVDPASQGMAMPRLTIRNLMIAVALLALEMADARLAIVLLLLAGAAATLLPRNRRWAVPYFVTLSCLYLPFSWLVLINYPWDSYRWHWIQRWPTAPGLPAGLFFHSNQFVESFVAGMTTLGLIVLLTWVGARGLKSLIAANGVALILAAMVSLVAYQLFWF